MKNYISQKEYDNFNQTISNLQKEREKLEKTLGKIMENSGSFASKTPAFNETEGLIKNLDQKIESIKFFLNNATVIKNWSMLPHGEIAVYSFVTALDAVSKKQIQYYIQHKVLFNKETAYLSITPNSPIGKALIGKKIGEKVLITLPQKILELEIINIENKFL